MSDLKTLSDSEPSDFFADSSCAQTNSANELLSFTVEEREKGERLDQVLAGRLPDFSRSLLARLAKEGKVLLDGRSAKASSLVRLGQTISLPEPKPPRTELTANPEIELAVIYEDEHILVVNKPADLVVHPAPSYQGPTLAGALLARDKRLLEVGEKFRPGLVHRLDRDTSGVLISAKTEPALRALAASFGARATTKRYLALASGCFKASAGLIDQAIGRHPSLRHKMAAGVSGGRSAQTRYRVLRYFPAAKVSLVLLTLITGRTHQARVHLASLGHPILADSTYSRGASELLRKYPSLAPLLLRQQLHARSLTIAHPISGDLLTFTAPWPLDFKGVFFELLRLEKESFLHK